MSSLQLWLAAVLLILVTMASPLTTMRPYVIPMHPTELPAMKLPQSVSPTAYAVRLHPNITGDQYNGSVQINITCHEPTNIITLHAHHELNITHVEIKNMDNIIQITDISRNDTNEIISITVENELESGVSYQLYFVFNGELLSANKLNGSPYGYRQQQIGGFISNSLGSPGFSEVRWSLGIVMSPRSLRRVFPCFDEPSFKATFQISISHWSNMSAVSVMPIEYSEKAEDDMVIDHFSRTPPLSTISVGVLVFNFEKNSTTTESTKNGDISVYFYKRQQMHFGNNLPQTNSTVRMLDYLQDYLDIQYPLQKLDIVGWPNLYYSNSHSALGLIAIQEYMIYEGPNIIGQELVNQWFRHMTTPRQWEFFNITDILSDYIINDAVNKLGIKTNQFYMQRGDLYNIFGSDFTAGNHWQPNGYDTLKGSWFIKMLNSSLTEKTLQTAFKNLLKNNMYSTYTPEMLWEEITKQAYSDGTLPETITVTEIANSWLENRRFPVLTITRNYEDDSAKLEQHMYSTNMSHKLTEAEQGIVWPIPITYLTNSQKSHTSHPVTWMSDKEMDINNLPDANSFIIVNPTDSGMFLVNYDKHNWALISENLLSNEYSFSTETRRKLVQDVMLLASVGELNYATALNVTLFLFNETDYRVWMPFIQNIQSIEQITHYTPVETKLNKYIRLLLSPIIGSGTYTDQTQQNPEYMNFWYQARGVLERIGYQPFIDDMYKNTNRTTPIFTYYDNETELVVFCPKSPTNESEWSTYATNMYQFSHMYTYMKRAICKCPGYIEYVRRMLNKTLDEETAFASYEFYQIIQLTTGCSESQNITLTFFLEHFDELRQRYYHVKDVWTTLVSGIVSKIRDGDQLRAMTQFFEENQKKFGYSKLTVRNELQMAKTTIEKIDKRSEEIELWLDEVLPRIETNE